MPERKQPHGHAHRAGQGHAARSGYEIDDPTDSSLLADNATSFKMWLTIPANVILSWPRRNEINPERRGPEVYAVSGLFLSLAVICVTARLYTRIFIRKFFGLDDGLVLLGLVSATCGVVRCFHGYLAGSLSRTCLCHSSI